MLSNIFFKKIKQKTYSGNAINTANNELVIVQETQLNKMQKP